MKFSDYIIYADESGDPSLTKIDDNYPIFVLVFCIIKKSDYQKAVCDLLELKFKTFGHDMIVLHEREIRKRTGEFALLNDPEIRNAFLGGLSALVAGAPMTIVATVIKKKDHAKKYSAPMNPYDIALGMCLERAHGFLKANGQEKSTTYLIVESRGRVENDALELAFRRICTKENNQWSDGLAFDLRFSKKDVNSTGLQLADLVGRPIGQHILSPGSQARIWPVIEAKVRCKPGTSTYTGWGLKVFP